MGSHAPHIADERPAVFHITHWKAGSQWVLRVLLRCVPELIVHPEIDRSQFRQRPLQAGKVYPTVYVPKNEFDTVVLPRNWRRFVIIRDLRDTLISAYFSSMFSHTLMTKRMEDRRNALQPLGFEDGLIYLIDDFLPGCARIQSSWLEAGERLIRYEDLLENDVEIFERVLIEECRLPISRSHLREAVIDNRFEHFTGRKRGDEDVMAHDRKGVAGDWRNYFSDRVKQSFKDRYGDLLIATGYEQDPDW